MKKKQDKQPVCCSIIIPVYNEEKVLHHLLQQLKQYPCEIIVVDGHPEQTTSNTITDKSIIKIASSTGRGRQLQTGANKAQGDVLWFLHADTIPVSNAINTIIKTMENKSNIGGAFCLKIDSNKVRYRLLERCINLRSRITRIPYGDQGIFVRKSYFDSIGGFQSIPLMEDLEFMKRIKHKGDRICFLKESIMTSSRRWEQEGMLRCTLRNLFIRTLYYLGVHPNTLVKWYRNTDSHEQKQQ